MQLPRPGVRTSLRTGARRFADKRHWLTLRRLGRSRPADYREYLAVQLERTLSKRETDPGAGAMALIDSVARAQPAGPVLCVGSRNALELDRFRARGFEDVVGIDLFSQREDILVMDMHSLAFDEDSFDVVYCSHALEHAYDVDRVAAEMVRVARNRAVVAIEVPIRVQASAADRVVFAGLDELRNVFAGHVAEELLGEEQPPHSPTNDQGTEIARLVFRLRK